MVSASRQPCRKKRSQSSNGLDPSRHTTIFNSSSGHYSYYYMLHNSLIHRIVMRVEKLAACYLHTCVYFDANTAREPFFCWAAHRCTPLGSVSMTFTSMTITFMFNHVSLWETFDSPCVWFASRSDVAAKNE